MAATYTVGTGKTYSTIQDAIDAIPGDLSGQGVQTVEVYAGGTASGDAHLYKETVDMVTGFSNESDANRIDITAMVANQGKRATGIVIEGPTGSLVAGDGWVLKCLDYSRITGLGITISGTHNDWVQGIKNYGTQGGGHGIIDGCVVYGLATTGNSARGIIVYSNAADGITVKNCMVMDIDGTTSSEGIYLHAAVAATSVAYNCSVANVRSATSVYGIRSQSQNHTITNCIAHTVSGTDYYANASTPVVTYCISTDDTADDWGGSGNQINKDKDTDIQWVSTTVGGEDLHLQSGSCAEDAGVAIGDVTEDIDGDTRNDPPEIGADELPVTAVDQAIWTGG